jgi:Ser/Thr protein kinase RdoA (MazF antagonist)
MIKFKKPINLNGSELLAELNEAGIFIVEPPVLDGNNDLWLEIKDADKTKTATIVENHDGQIVAQEPTIEQKLISLGLSVDDLKAALGL